MYKEKTVHGLLLQSLTKIKINQCEVTVRATSDKRGKSLSLSVDNMMIMIPLEKVTDIIVMNESNNTEEQ